MDFSSSPAPWVRRRFHVESTVGVRGVGDHDFFHEIPCFFRTMEQQGVFRDAGLSKSYEQINLHAVSILIAPLSFL